MSKIQDKVAKLLRQAEDVVGTPEEAMTSGQQHAERRKAQAAAARKHKNRARAQKRPGKSDRNNWKREV